MKKRVIAAASLTLGYGAFMALYAWSDGARLDAWFLRFSLGAVMMIATGAGLLLARRWARWIALGTALCVLGNALTTLLAGEDIGDGQLGWQLTPFLLFGALAVAACLSGSGMRDHFEPGWSGPITAVFRWAAIATVACVPPAFIAAQRGEAYVPAAALLVLGAVLMLAARVAGVPIALAALAALGSSGAGTTAFDPKGLAELAWLSEGWLFAVGPYTVIGWFVAVGLLLAAIFSLARPIEVTLRGQ